MQATHGAAWTSCQTLTLAPDALPAPVSQNDVGCAGLVSAPDGDAFFEATYSLIVQWTTFHVAAYAEVDRDATTGTVTHADTPEWECTADRLDGDAFEACSGPVTGLAHTRYAVHATVDGETVAQWGWLWSS